MRVKESVDARKARLSIASAIRLGHGEDVVRSARARYARLCAEELRRQAEALEKEARALDE